MKVFIASCIAVAALVTAGTVSAQAPTPTEYVKKAGRRRPLRDHSSRLVLSSTTDAKLRSFASMMVSQHTKSTADVKAAAMRAKLHPAPAKLSPEQSDMIAQLRAASGPARDQAYVAQQKQAHDQALALHQGYAADGTSPSLKMVAAKVVPVVQSHITMLGSM